MILFKEDWDKYPSAIVHYTTKNKSALQLSVLLKKMGQENNKFFLSLLNPKLINIDPHDPNLTYQEKVMVVEECQANFWYYIREVARVPVKGSPEPIMLELNRANIALFWLYFLHITQLLIQPRQTGKSLNVDELIVWLSILGLIKSNIEGVTKNTSLRGDEIERLKDIINTLPPYLNLRSKKDTNNMEDVTIKALGNRVRFSVAQKDKSAALNIGRGVTSANVFIDEIAFILNIDLTLPTILAAMNAAVDEAKKNGSPYGRVFYTTAGFLDTPSGEFVYKNIYSKAFRFKEVLYDMKNKEEVYSFIVKNSQSKTPLVLVEMNHRSLNKSDEWLAEKLSEAMSSGERGEADYLLKWSRGSSNSALDKKIYKILSNSITEPDHTEVSPFMLCLDWYIPENEKEKYQYKPFAIGLDTSDGFGNDDLGFVGRDPITGEVIVKGKYNNLSLHEFGEFLFWFMKKYSRSTLIFERKSSGMSICDHIVTHMCANDMNPFKRIFNWVIDDDRYHEVVDNFNGDLYLAYIENKKYFGYATSGSGRNARSNLYGDVLMESLKLTGDSTRDKDLVHQLLRLELKNGRIDHKPNEHDDLVIAYMLCFWLFTRARNIDLYGYRPESILTAVIISDSDFKSEQEKKEKAAERHSIVDEINILLDKLKATDDKYIKLKSIARITLLKSKLTKEDVVTLNLEQQLKEIQKNKKDTHEDLTRWY